MKKRYGISFAKNIARSTYKVQNSVVFKTKLHREIFQFKKKQKKTLLHLPLLCVFQNVHAKKCSRENSL